MNNINLKTNFNSIKVWVDLYEQFPALMNDEKLYNFYLRLKDCLTFKEKYDYYITQLYFELGSFHDYIPIERKIETENMYKKINNILNNFIPISPEVRNDLSNWSNKLQRYIKSYEIHSEAICLIVCLETSNLHNVIIFPEHEILAKNWLFRCSEIIIEPPISNEEMTLCKYGRMVKANLQIYENIKSFHIEN